MLYPEKKLSLIENIIDWELLEQHLGHHFEQQSAPPFRLMIGLLYLKAMNDISYEETLKEWDSSPLWQRFCGGFQANSGQPMRASTLSIWNREIGDKGLYWMRIAVTVMPQESQLLH